MLQNKIYQNFFAEIFKNFFIILFALSLIALTVRAVSFLDLIVDNGYPVIIYFKYCFLNLFGIAPKFIPLSLLLALTIFIVKHLQDSEFVILWTSGVKKIYLINLLFFISIIILLIYFIFTTVLSPVALNKSRQLLGNDKLNSILPIVRSQQFSDTFDGFTFIVEKRVNNEIENIFLHDNSSNLSKLSSNPSETSSTTIIAENGIIKEKKMFLLNGYIITSKKNLKNEIAEFEQLNIDMSHLSTKTIKEPKIQETSTIKLLKCMFNKLDDLKYCNEDFKKEIVSNLSRRIVTPFYIPVISLICGFLLIKSNKIILNKASIFFYGFVILIFTEIAVRYTGINKLILMAYIFTPFILYFVLYVSLIYKFSKHFKI